MPNKNGNSTVTFRRYVISLICVAIIAVLGTYKVTDMIQQRQIESETEAYPHSSDLEKVVSSYETIVQKYVGDYDKKELVDGAIKGMMGALDDPYSDYYSGEEATEFNSVISGSFEGIGAVMTLKDGAVTIAESPIKDSPAEKANLKTNDIVLKVDDEELKDVDLNTAVSKIRGEKGTEVKLTIERDGTVFDVSIKRDTIPIESVYSELDKENPTIGHIQITTFSENTANEFQTAVKSLRKDGAKSFIVDVRSNPGGLMDQVAIISSMFLKDKKPIVKFENKDNENEVLVASSKLDKGFKIKEPTVVLVDGSSASASEILAAALNESADIPVIGEKTYGKGTVQTVQHLTSDSDLKLTTQKWLTPNGTWIHKKGLEPSIKVALPDYSSLTPIDTSSTYSEGAEGEAVKNINAILQALDYKVSKDSESYSVETVNAVREFQREAKLEETGSISKETAIKLVLALRDKIVQNDLVYKRGIQELVK